MLKTSDPTLGIPTSLKDEPAKNYPPWKIEFRHLFVSTLRARYPYGLLHEVISNAEWAQLPNHGDAPNPQPPDALAGNAGNAAVAMYKSEEELCLTYRQAAADCRNTLIASLGPTLRERFSNPLAAGTITMTSLEIVTAVHVLYGVRTALDLKTIEGDMQEVLSSPDLDSFLKFSQAFSKNVRLLNDAGQPLSTHSQLDQFERLLLHHDQPLKAFRLYVEAHPLLADRSLAAVITAIEVHLTNVTSSIAGYAAPMVSVLPPTIPTLPFAGSTAALSPADITRLLDLLTKMAPGGTTMGGGGGRPAKFKQSGPTSYCYVHGYLGHDGNSCKKMKSENAASPGTFSRAKLNAKTHTEVPGGHP